MANHEFLSGTSRLLAYLKITGRNGRDGRNPSQNITTHYPVYPILLEFFHYYYFSHLPNTLPALRFRHQLATSGSRQISPFYGDSYVKRRLAEIR